MEAPADSDAASFYLRYYVGHKGRFGHEFMEFEIRPDGRFRYANGSLYKGDGMIRKEARVHVAIVDEVKRIIRESAILKADDSLWPEPDRVGRQELEVVLDGEQVRGRRRACWRGGTNTIPKESNPRTLTQKPPRGPHHAPSANRTLPWAAARCKSFCPRWTRTWSASPNT